MYFLLIFYFDSQHRTLLKINPYYLAGASSYVIWGFFPIALKSISDYSSGQILFYRVCFTLFFLAFTALVIRRRYWRETWKSLAALKKNQRTKVLLLTFLSGILLAGNWLSFIYVVNHIGIQIGAFAYLVCPIMTAVLGVILLNEKLKINQIIAVLICLVSCAMLGSGSLTNLAYSMLTAATYAFYIIVQRYVRQYDKLTMLAFHVIVSFVCIAPFYDSLLSGGFETNWIFFLTITLISLVFTIAPLLLNLFVLKELSSGTVGILMYINPIINFVIAFAAYREQADWERIVAYLLIGIALILYNLRFKMAAVNKS
jgi:chloramphenicol-sensitive protein RarD